MIRKVLSAPFRYKLWRPSHIRLVVDDLTGLSRQAEHDHSVHLEAVIGWLCAAQDQRKGHTDAGGVSAGWSFEDGWLPSYPETSGYIVETFIAAARLLERPELVERAHRILDWELSIQHADGSFPGHFGEAGSHPVIFNTGQIMHGMVAGYAELGREECLEAALRAGRWMLKQQDDDGCWRRSVHNRVPHTYNTRAAWALLKTATLANEPTLQQSSISNLQWALSQQTSSGWYQCNGFVEGQTPYTHTIAYATRGLLESGLLLGEERFVASAQRAAAALAKTQRYDGWMAGTYDDGWLPKASYCCLTGLAQMTLIWQRLCQIQAEERLFQRAVELALSYLKKNHRTARTGNPHDGAVAGSAPIWGRYSMFEFPNWASKFFADALMMAMSDTPIPATFTRHAVNNDD